MNFGQWRKTHKYLLSTDFQVAKALAQVLNHGTVHHQKLDTAAQLTLLVDTLDRSPQDPVNEHTGIMA